MLGGMLSVFLVHAGFPLILAIAGAILLTVVVGVLIELVAIEPAKGLRCHLTDHHHDWCIVDRPRTLPRDCLEAAFIGCLRLAATAPLSIFWRTGFCRRGLWVFGVTILALVAIAVFFSKARFGKAMLATSYNRLAARPNGQSTCVQCW